VERSPTFDDGPAANRAGDPHASARAGRFARAAVALVLDRLFPVFCLGCARRIGPEGSPLLLCARCRGSLERIDPRASCSGCARPLPSGRSDRPRCVDCRLRPPPYERLRAIWRYRPPLDAVIRALKFGGLDFLAAALVEEALSGGADAGRASPAAIVPVPLPLVRRLTRGFNQAERIAAALADRLGAPCLELLARPGWPAAPQHRLGRLARRANPALRFARRGSPPAGPLLLVDDVVTTGATLRAAASALHGDRGGRGRKPADAVQAWVLAATPP
jgi:ComF family protein